MVTVANTTKIAAHQMRLSTIQQESSATPAAPRCAMPHMPHRVRQTGGVEAERGEEISRAFARADANYVSIKSFVDWRPDDVDLSAWDDASGSLAARRSEADREALDASVQERLRAAAVDTGAIEGLYTTDRGFTLSVAQQVISLDQAEVEKGADFRRNFEAQLKGFELALDVATSATPISEALIRRLHEVTCAGQTGYRVLTPLGVQERRLPLGSYKSEPNHVQLGDGSFHAYAPADRVPDEMHSLVEQIGSSEFEAAHPVIQAAYVHHAFTAIHPFADGNGRVARLLASIWLLRAASIPLWVEPTDRDRYLDALRAADGGDGGGFVEHIGRMSLRLLRTSVAELATEQAWQRKKLRDGRDRLHERLRELATSRLRTVLAGGSGPMNARTSADVEFVDKPDLLVVGASVAERFWLGAGIDWGSPPESRFVVEAGPFGISQLGSRKERFEENEVLPRLTLSAERRLEAFIAWVVLEAD